MTAETWQKIREAFGAALGLEGDARDSYLAALPGSLGVEVRSLLDAHDDASGFLETDAGEIPAGTRIGAFRVLDKIGEGGMGAVYRGLRDHGDFEQRVAIKLAGSPIATAEMERRFVLERQTLARLNHPHIVRLLDGGEWQGRRYFAMEYVDGLPITGYARDLPVTAKLRLFRTVCAAIHFAHQNLIVHRDIKPGNILVTTDGEVKVLDFGIAKLLDAGLAGADTTRLQPLSLDCASPEQVRGEPVTTATDVYALGVLLYQLLTGAHPQGGPAQSLERTIRQICDDPPPRPSAAVPVLARDLDSIVLRAMQKDARSRYDSAAELSADVERFLEGRPVAARNATFWYVALKFVVRNRWPAAAAACVALLLAGGAGAVVWQARIAARERALAQRRFEETRKLARAVIFDMQGQLANLPGSLAVRRQMIAQTLTYLESMARDARGNTELLLDIAGSYARVGSIQSSPGNSNLGDTAGALRSWQTALRLIDPLLADDRHPDALRLASTVNSSLAGLFNYLGKGSEAAAHLDYAVAFARRLEHAAPGRPESAETLGNALFFRAITLRDGPAEIRAWEETLQVYQGILRTDPKSPKKLRNVALCAKYLANALLRQEELPRAMQYAVQARTLDEELLSRAPGDRGATIDLCNDLGTIGTIQVNLGRAADAVGSLQRNLELRRLLAGQDPDDAMLRERFAVSHQTLAWALLESGRNADARTEYAAAIAALQPILASSGSASIRGDIATAEWGVAQASRRLGQEGDSCRWFAHADADYRQAYPEGIPNKVTGRLMVEAAAAAAACSGR